MWQPFYNISLFTNVNHINTNEVVKPTAYSGQGIEWEILNSISLKSNCSYQLGLSVSNGSILPLSPEFSLTKLASGINLADLSRTPIILYVFEKDKMCFF